MCHFLMAARYLLSAGALSVKLMTVMDEPVPPLYPVGSEHQEFLLKEVIIIYSTMSQSLGEVFLSIMHTSFEARGRF